MHRRSRLCGATTGGSPRERLAACCSRVEGGVAARGAPHRRAVLVVPSVRRRGAWAGCRMRRSSTPGTGHRAPVRPWRVPTRPAPARPRSRAPMCERAGGARRRPGWPRGRARAPNARGRSRWQGARAGRCLRPAPGAGTADACADLRHGRSTPRRRHRADAGDPASVSPGQRAAAQACASSRWRPSRAPCSGTCAWRHCVTLRWRRRRLRPPRACARDGRTRPD